MDELIDHLSGIGWTEGQAKTLSGESEPNEAASEKVMDTCHQAVMPREVIEGLGIRAGMTVLDGTAGAGGHTSLIARIVGPTGLVIGLDRDPAMLELARRTCGDLPVRLIKSSYSDAPEVLADLGVSRIDAMLLDLGLSSDQLAWRDRGFSFAHDGPLDMRFDPDSRETAADLVNRQDVETLANGIYQYGEERFSRRIARKIVETRRIRPILTTGQLADLVRRCVPGKRGSIDPATRTFQALRIQVNQELDHLETALAFLADLLPPGGRAAIISFHSLEDRLVKTAFRSNPLLRPLTKKPLEASEDEIAANPRARSAKLRVAERCAI